MALTLRQIEVIRSVLVAGTIAGAARLMNVAQPGVSRTIKHIESSIGIKLFVKKAGRYVPTTEARDVFLQLEEVHRKVDQLQYSIAHLERGRGMELSLGSVPSIANVMVPQAMERILQDYPELKINFEILKIEEAIDYLLLGRGEVVAMSCRLEHPSITFQPLASGQLVCIAAREHAIATRQSISAREIIRYPLIGIDRKDPYGAIITSIFDQQKLEYQMAIKARFGTTVCTLVKRNLGIAVVDAFTVADMPKEALAIIPIEEETHFQTYIAYRTDAALSSYAERFVKVLKKEMQQVIAKT